jgi:imidazolonepropionase-like amidohydrolase
MPPKSSASTTASGTLEAGKDADIAVFDGHPFDFPQRTASSR